MGSKSRCISSQINATHPYFPPFLAVFADFLASLAAVFSTFFTIFAGARLDPAFQKGGNKSFFRSSSPSHPSTGRILCRARMMKEIVVTKMLIIDPLAANDTENTMVHFPPYSYSFCQPHTLQSSSNHTLLAANIQLL